jgi:hypothetical protein
VRWKRDAKKESVIPDALQHGPRKRDVVLR